MSKPSAYSRKLRRRDMLLRWWIEAPLSEHNRAYRRQALNYAFGLPSGFIDRWYARHASCGSELIREMIKWARQYPDLGANNPAAIDRTFFVTLNLS